MGILDRVYVTTLEWRAKGEIGRKNESEEGGRIKLHIDVRDRIKAQDYCAKDIPLYLFGAHVFMTSEMAVIMEERGKTDLEEAAMEGEIAVDHASIRVAPP